jgi:hypothetical protein
VKTGSLAEMLFLGVFITKSIPFCSPRVKFGTLLKIRIFPRCHSEWIGMLAVKIGREVKKLFERGFFGKITLFLP